MENNEIGNWGQNLRMLESISNGDSECAVGSGRVEKVRMTVLGSYLGSGIF